MRSRLFVYLCLSMFLACTIKPANVLSDKKMENVLFDLYMAEAGMSDNPGIFYNDSAKKQDLLQSVFKKHKTSQAKFDTSLVWYNANLKNYLKINTLVEERYEYRIRQLQAEIDRIRRAEERARGNLRRFEDMNLPNFLTSSLAFWQKNVLDFLVLLADTIPQDTATMPEKTYRFQRYCFYEPDTPDKTYRFQRYCFYEEE